MYLFERRPVRTQDGGGDGDIRYLLHEDGEEQRVDDQHEEPGHQPLARLGYKREL